MIMMKNIGKITDTILTTNYSPNLIKKHMKKFFFFAIAALGMMAGCQKQSVDTTPVDENTPVAVTFGINAPKVEVTKTKALGGLDEWNKQTLYVYGFAHSVKDFAAEEAFIDNVAVEAPVAAPAGDVNAKGDVIPQNPVLDDEGQPTGTTEPFYYAPDNTIYDFYGYYVDDAASAVPTKEADRIYVPVTITGGQDIMLAKADKIKDVENTTVDPLRAYSAYSARHFVKPTLKFEHQLARFNFYVVAGSATTVEAGKEITVTDVKIKDAKVSADLNIVGANRGLVDNAASATLADLTLMQKGTDGLEALEPVGPAAYYADPDVRKENKTKVGESIMVIPGEDSYEMVFSLKQANVAAPVPTEPITLKIEDFGVEAAADGEFMAGKQYNVTITVYGLEQVVISAELDQWENGGDYGYDPDEDWEEDAIKVPGSAYVYDVDSWGHLPVSYRSQHPWNNSTYADFPWLAAWCEAVDAGQLHITAAYPAYQTVDGEGNVIDILGGNAPMTGWPQPFAYAGTTNPESVFLLNETELGMEIVPGLWTITIRKDNADGDTVYTTTINVPAN